MGAPVLDFRRDVKHQRMNTDAQPMEVYVEEVSFN